jgi:hypothetical protein
MVGFSKRVTQAIQGDPFRQQVALKESYTVGSKRSLILRSYIVRNYFHDLYATWYAHSLASPRLAYFI